jgi:hypothetical protein
MARAPLKRNVIRLGHLDPKDEFLAEKDGDRLIVTVEEAINACFTHEEAKELIGRRGLFQQQIRLLVNKLGRWSVAHHEKVADAYLQTQADCQMFLVVLKGSEYDPELERDLSELTVEVANDDAFSMLRLDVQSLPNCSTDDVRSFIDIDE